MAIQKKLSGRAAGIFVLIFGLVFATIGGGFSYFSYTFAQTAIATSGIVTDVSVKRSSSSDGSSSVTYQPTISFTDQNGTSHSAQTFLSSSSYNYAIGTKVRILYNPSDPSSMRLDSWFALWGFGLIFHSVGLVTILIGLFVFRKSKSRSASQIEPDTAVDSTSQKAANFSYSSNTSNEAERASERPPTVRR